MTGEEKVHPLTLISPTRGEKIRILRFAQNDKRFLLLICVFEI